MIIRTMRVHEQWNQHGHFQNNQLNNWTKQVQENQIQHGRFRINQMIKCMSTMVLDQV